MTTPNPVTPVSSAPATQATLREFFAVLFRRRWITLGLFLSVTVTVLVIALSTPVRFASAGRVLITRGERESALSGRVQILNEWEQDLASEVAKVRSAPVLQRARELLAERARATHRAPLDLNYNGVDVEVVGKSNVIGIGYTDRDPMVAQQVCDALITAYLAYRQGANPGASDTLFANEMQALDRQIQDRLAERKQIASSTGVLATNGQTQSWIDQVSLLEDRRNQRKADLVGLQSSVASMRELLKNPEVDLPTTDNQFSSENALRTLKDRISTQQTVIANLRERYRDDAPEVQNAVQTLETLQALLRKEVEARLATIQGRSEVLQAEIRQIEGDIADVKAKLGRVPDNQNRVENIDAEVKTLRDRYDEYVKARDQAQITANVSSGVFVVLLNPAGSAVAKNSLDLVRLGLAPAFSLVVGVGLAFFIDGLDLTVRTAGQAEQYLELPVLATLPERRSRRR